MNSKPRLDIVYNAVRCRGHDRDETPLSFSEGVQHTDGEHESPYQTLAAKADLVGIYPVIPVGAVQPTATLTGQKHSSVAPHLDIRSLKLSVVDGLFLKVTFETVGAVLSE